MLSSAFNIAGSLFIVSVVNGCLIPLRARSVTVGSCGGKARKGSCTADAEPNMALLASFDIPLMLSAVC